MILSEKVAKKNMHEIQKFHLQIILKNYKIVFEIPLKTNNNKNTKIDLLFESALLFYELL